MAFGAARCAALLTAAHRHAHDEHEQHHRYGDHDYHDSCAHGQHHYAADYRVRRASKGAERSYAASGLSRLARAQESLASKHAAVPSVLCLDAGALALC